MRKIKHIELNEKFGMINLTEFSISATYIDEGEVIETFVRSEYYLKGSRTNYQIQNPTLKFLPLPILVNNVYKEHFRKLDKDGLRTYFFDYRNSEDRADSQESVSNLIDRFYEEYLYFSEQHFYLINLDWFDSHLLDFNSGIISDSWQYHDFFILLIWIDSNKNTLTVAEWFND